VDEQKLTLRNKYNITIKQVICYHHELV